MKPQPNPAVEKAMSSVAAIVPQAAADPQRPVYHFRPPANWMNDPNGTIYHNGIYHLFYQHNPYGDTWGHMHWSHARSTDLVTWEHLPIALWPSLDAGEGHCFSGCAGINGDGQPILLYTSVAPSPNKAKTPNQQWAALGDSDWLVWQKHKQNPFLALDTHGGPSFEGEWRDPFIFVEEGRTFLVIGGATPETSMVGLYEADDNMLMNWTWRGPLVQSTRDKIKFYECPNFFPVDGKWVLLTSPYDLIDYQIGTFDVDTLSFQAEQTGILDYGKGEHGPGFYASNILYDDKGPDGAQRCILLGWLRGFESGNGWNGGLALPRVLTIGPDGRPRQQPVPELKQLRGNHTELPSMMLMGSHPLENISGHTLEMRLLLEPRDATAVGLTVRQSANGERGVMIHYAYEVLDVAGTRVPFELDEDEPLLLHIFLDRSALEVFVNGGCEAITRVINAPIDDVGIELFAEDGPAQLISLDAWQMAGIW